MPGPTSQVGGIREANRIEAITGTALLRPERPVRLHGGRQVPSEMAWEHLMAEMGDSLIEINIPLRLAEVLELIAMDMEQSVDALLMSESEHAEAGGQLEEQDVSWGRGSHGQRRARPVRCR
uniref:Uncharacterized protein n=1 Tax=Branchiostoma floridae TaxID=7739 RepID=C3Z169_BRAFL|eukprot:XP_002597756.1 hypothetical protein BRAFLDRAFT_77341 [Branchiostoma floridae]